MPESDTTTPLSLNSLGINAEIARVKPEFRCSSLQVNVDSYCTPHTDSNNEGPPLLFLMGDFDGGAFRMTDQSIVIDTPNVIVEFDGRESH